MAPRLVSDKLLDLFVMNDRAPGRHVSTAIYRVMERLHPDRFDGSPINQVRAMLGNAMEHAIVDAIAREHPDRYIRPGELRKDGITGTPDLWDMWGGSKIKPRKPPHHRDWAVVEIKLTWASARRADDLEDPWWWRYWTQGKSYAHMSGMRKVIIMPTFINGRYDSGQPGVPCGQIWMEEFSHEDLEETWEMIKLYA